MQHAAKNGPVLLQFESKSDENSDVQPWHRLENEPPRWYLRFRIYTLLGPKRTLQAAVLAERMPQEVPESTESSENFLAGKNPLLYATPKLSPSEAKEEAKKLDVPGSWKDACRKYSWVERARAYDLWAHEARKRKRDASVKDADFAQASFRILVLNTLAAALREHLRKGAELTLRESLGCMMRLQSIMRDIAREMRDGWVSEP